MILRRLGIVLALLAFCSVPAMSQPLDAVGGSNAPAFGMTADPEHFRQVLSGLLAGMENAMGLPPNASEAVRNASPQELDLMLRYVENPEAFYSSAQRIQGYLAAGEQGLRGSGSDLSARTAQMTAPFTPDYPSSTGLYADLVLGQLAAFDLITYASDRCDSDKLGDFYSIYYIAKKISEQADGVCVLAGCDPTGIGCAIACGVVEIYKVAVVTAALPLELCAYQDNNIDSAEIQAGYQNSVSILNDLADHDTSVLDAISTHDGDIKAYLDILDGKLDQQAGMLEKVLENQILIIKLLNTPQGRRPDWPNKTPFQMQVR